ncbi:hypothetical protein Sru01_47340 [Sphaerisporangium rufum]|uniref:Anti-sigma factor antagonist n=1 Tax=Sphaerisporangium rufum TaxID=1381558 RepID=A0A919V2I9_9ACTN|nr:hypothetical protein Sru01_47340 [Sphaerisporangium rufum]
MVEISGELDMTAVPRVRAELETVIDGMRPPCLTLDLTRTTFCDSLGLGLLVHTYNTVRQMGGRVVLVVPPDGMITRLLTITNLDHHFEVHPTLDDALAGFQAA